MHKGRLEAFSDGVVAILITIMVLELHVPEGRDLAALTPLLPVLIAYGVSFLMLAIYWHNHHHLLQSVSKVNGAVLWANTHLLFWLSLIPWLTAWTGRHEFATWPVALFGLDLLGCAIAYTILVQVLIAHHGKGSLLARAVGSDVKGKISVAIYVFGVLLAFPAPRIAYALYFAVAVIWIVPDRRIERVLNR